MFASQRHVVGRRRWRGGGALTRTERNRSEPPTSFTSLRRRPYSRGCPQCKLDAIATYGGAITRCKATVPDREATAGRIQADTGATLIPPYNHGPVICGQGTIGAEFMAQVPGLDVVVVPISGGGMIAGVATAVKGINPGCAVVAAEPSGSRGDAADAAASMARGTLVGDMPAPDTIADGLKAKMGDLTWPIVRDKVDAVVVVEEAEIVAAMRLVFERMKLVVEPSGAAGLAAALSPHFKRRFLTTASGGEGGGGETAGGDAEGARGKKKLVKVGVVLCGGNLDLAALFAAYS